jgi:hypothetical protein
MSPELQLKEIPSWLEGTKNCFTDGFLYRSISQADITQTIFRSEMELDDATSTPIAGHDIFALIGLQERLDLEIALDLHRAKVAARAAQERQ